MAANAPIINENLAVAAVELHGHCNRKWVKKKQLAAAEQRAPFCVYTCKWFN